MDYVIVSEEVWRRLKLIYGAYPEFRRSGDSKTIEIYPKTFKIYTKVRKGRIDYDEEKVCEFSCNMMLNEMLSKVLECGKEELVGYSYFFKTCTINRWEGLGHIEYRVSDLTSEQLVFLAIVEQKEREKFMAINCHPAQEPENMHIGD